MESNNFQIESDNFQMESDNLQIKCDNLQIEYDTPSNGVWDTFKWMVARFK